MERLAGTRFLYAGFSVLLIAFVVLGVYIYQQFSSANQALVSETANNNRQSSAAMAMRVAVRERAILLWHMTSQDDVFLKDELHMRFLEFGSRYHDSRQTLLNSELTDEEKALMASLDRETGQRAPLLREFAEVLMRGEKLDSYHENLNRVVADQGVVASLLDQLIQIQQQHNEAARTENARVTSQHLAELVVAVILFIAIAVAFARNVVKAAETQNSELAAANERLDQLARQDHLTGLLNRLSLKEPLELGLAMAKRHNQKGALFFIDLDGFKSINDSYGHDIGDELLVKISGAINDMRESDLVARLGGDEFVIVIFNVLSRDQVAAIAEKIRRKLSAEYRIGEDILARVSASIGICMFPAADMTAASLVKCADEAMYQAKQSGKNQFAFCKIEPVYREQGEQSTG